MQTLLKETIDLIAPIDPKLFSKELETIQREEEQAENELIKERLKWGIFGKGQTYA